MKKNILFVIDSLVCAGAEKSLITLLSLMDFEKYNIDLQLFAYGRPLEQFIPKEVNLLKPFKYTNFTQLGLRKSLITSIRNRNFKMLSARIKYSLALRKENSGNIKKARLYWENISEVIEKNPKQYDIAISYAQGVPTFYTIDKVDAYKKFAWVNVTYRLQGEERQFQKRYYDRYDKIIAVSDSAKDIFLENFNEYKNKTEVIYDINDYKMINNLSSMDKGYDDDFDGIRILTIGRLAAQKGYDIALDACKRLNNKKINFRWYVLGVGPLESEIKNFIEENNLNDRFKLLGVKANPYPFIRNCDIYVQTSKFEGFGLAIAEARILNKLVVTTEFDSVYNQMVQRKNGLVVGMDGESVCNGILELLENKKLSKDILEYLKNEKKGNLEEVKKIYELIN